MQTSVGKPAAQPTIFRSPRSTINGTAGLVVTSSQQKQDIQNGQSLPIKVSVLSKKVDEIVNINESLEARLETMRHEQERKDSRNQELRTKVNDLNEQVRILKIEV